MSDTNHTSIEGQLTEQLKAAMRAKDQPTLDVIRMIRAKITEARTAKGFSGQVDDAMVQGVIEAYVKSLEKAKVEYEAAGERALPMLEGIEFELRFLRPFLPARLDEAATRALVNDTIASLGVDDPKQAGRVMGAIMKTHRDEVDAALVKRLVGEALAGE